MKCWICGNDGKSGEHLLQASDVRSVFDEISQQSPIYYHTDDRKNIPVGSSKSDRFKSKALICTRCNNETTAPHDKAWEKLSKALRNYPLDKRGPLKIRLTRAFKTNVFMNSVYVQLFFLKKFGCRIVEDAVPINVDSFASSILNNKPNPFVYLHFRKGLKEGDKVLRLSTVLGLKINDNLISAGWVYTVDYLNVEVIYAPYVGGWDGMRFWFHPDSRNKIVKFDDFEK